MGTPRAGRRAARETGAYGNNRGKPALAKTRRREGDKRVQTGLAKARADQAALDARIMAEQAAELLRVLPSVMPTDVVSKPAPAPRRAPRKSQAQPALDPWRRGETIWSLGEARQMVADGYSLARVIKRTGWGEGWFNDLKDARP